MVSVTAHAESMRMLVQVIDSQQIVVDVVT